MIFSFSKCPSANPVSVEASSIRPPFIWKRMMWFIKANQAKKRYNWIWVGKRRLISPLVLVEKKSIEVEESGMVKKDEEQWMHGNRQRWSDSSAQIVKHNQVFFLIFHEVEFSQGKVPSPNKHNPQSIRKKTSRDHENEKSTITQMSAQYAPNFKLI